MTHTIYFNASQNMSNLKDDSVDLIVTSPPYPMIEMWDGIMAKQNPAISDAFNANNPKSAFELMHKELDKVWKECWRVLKPGCFMCINIGDATRTINGNFSLYNNNARIIQACESIGFTTLTNILWRKPTNAPNKFLGSGMLPCGAYVTLEHEWILIFRKGGNRLYDVSEKAIRRDSSFFWEERNIWFSDLWELNGTKQNISNSKTRKRSASYPLAIPYRLINMYSQKNDIVLDPFFGLGTTTIAAMLSERNSIGIEIDPLLKPSIIENLSSIDVLKMNQYIYNRYQSHLKFVSQREAAGHKVKYYNKAMKCKVMTKQETQMTLHYIKDIQIHDKSDLTISCEYDNPTQMDNLVKIYKMDDFQMFMMATEKKFSKPASTSVVKDLSPKVIEEGTHKKNFISDNNADIKILTESYGELSEGKVIELELGEACKLLHRTRVRADSFKKLQKHLKEEYGVTLKITSRKHNIQGKENE